MTDEAWLPPVLRVAGSRSAQRRVVVLRPEAELPAVCGIAECVLVARPEDGLLASLRARRRRVIALQDDAPWNGTSRSLLGFATLRVYAVLPAARPDGL